MVDNLVLAVLLARKSHIENLFYGAPAAADTSLIFCHDCLCLWLQSVQDDFQHHSARVAYKADGSITKALLLIAFLRKHDK